MFEGTLDSDAFLPKWSRFATGGSPLPYPAMTRAPHEGLSLRVTWDPDPRKPFVRTFATYQEVRDFVEFETADQLLGPDRRPFMDPYMYDLHRAVRLVEEYGDELPGLVDVEWERETDPLTLEEHIKPFPKRMDTCDCERLLACPNGTKVRNANGGATELFDCVKTGSEVVRRANVIPQSAAKYTWWGERFDARREWNKETKMMEGSDMFLRNHSDFSELSGDDDMTVGTLFLRTFETAVLTVDLRRLAVNLTYDDHYRIAVYVDCKPCPVQYACDYEQEPPTCTNGPSVALQQINMERCLAKHVNRVCANATGAVMDCDRCGHRPNAPRCCLLYPQACVCA